MNKKLKENPPKKFRLISAITSLAVLIGGLIPTLNSNLIADADQLQKSTEDNCYHLKSSDDNFTEISNSLIGITTEEADTKYLLGVASQFNVFLQNDFTAYNSDVEGRLAVGGDVISECGYNFNIGNGTDKYAPQTYATGVAHIIAGGDLKSIALVEGATYGRTEFTGIMKDTIYFQPRTVVLQEDSTIKNKDNNIIDKDTTDGVHLVCLKDSNNNYVDYTNNSTLDYQGEYNQYGYMGLYAESPNINTLDYANIYKTDTPIINFDNEFSKLQQTSSSFKATSGTSIDISNNTATFSWQGDTAPQEAIVFDATNQWNDLVNTFDFNFNVPQNSYIVVLNTAQDRIYLGGSNNMGTEGNKNVTLWGNQLQQNDSLANYLLFDFPNASEVIMGRNFYGSILAPNANVMDREYLGMQNNDWVNGDNGHGHLSGALIAKSYKGYSEFSFKSFNVESSILPEETTTTTETTTPTDTTTSMDTTTTTPKETTTSVITTTPKETTTPAITTTTPRETTTSVITTTTPRETTTPAITTTTPRETTTPVITTTTPKETTTPVITTTTPKETTTSAITTTTPKETTTPVITTTTPKETTTPVITTTTPKETTTSVITTTTPRETTTPVITTTTPKKTTTSAITTTPKETTTSAITTTPKETTTSAITTTPKETTTSAITTTTPKETTTSAITTTTPKETTTSVITTTTPKETTTSVITTTTPKETTTSAITTTPKETTTSVITTTPKETTTPMITTTTLKETTTSAITTTTPKETTTPVITTTTLKETTTSVITTTTPKETTTSAITTTTPRETTTSVITTTTPKETTTSAITTTTPKETTTTTKSSLISIGSSSNSSNKTTDNAIMVNKTTSPTTSDDGTGLAISGLIISISIIFATTKRKDD